MFKRTILTTSILALALLGFVHLASTSVAANDPYNMWVAVDGQKTGPHNSNALVQLIKQGKLTRRSLVWEQGMQNWVPAGSVSKVEKLFKLANSPGQQPSANPGGTQQPSQPPVNPGSNQQPGNIPQGTGNNPVLDQLAALERQDFGVPASDRLHTGPMHGPTPNRIPGGQLITTKGLVQLVQSRQVQYLLFDVLGGPATLPGAIPAALAAQAGSFQDGIQQQMNTYLTQATGGNKQVPLIFYCQSVQCWMSYNAALRAIKLGYTNVLWYRGGIEAWQKAGFQTIPANQNSHPQKFR